MMYSMDVFGENMNKLLHFLPLFFVWSCSTQQEENTTTEPHTGTTGTIPTVTEVKLATLDLFTDIITVDWDSGQNEAALTATVVSHGGGTLTLLDKKKSTYTIEWTLIDGDGVDISPTAGVDDGDAVEVIYVGDSNGYWFYQGFTLRDENGGLLMAFVDGDVLDEGELTPVTAVRADSPYAEAVMALNGPSFSNTVDAYELIFTNAKMESVSVEVGDQSEIMVDKMPMQVMNINTTVIVNTHITDVDFNPTVYGVWR
jgi:hypothetical protein